MSRLPVIIPVASGKGGVGKTLISVNLGFALANLGKKTILIDLDFGGANIHTCMGYSIAPDGIGNFLNQRAQTLERYLLTTSHKNLQLIPGDAEMVGIADITAVQKKKLISQIYNLDAEYIILDLGAGSSYNTIDFFTLSPYSILVAMPELTSILNAYALLKTSIFRLLYLEFKSYPEIKSLFNRQMKKGGENAWKVSELLNYIFDIDPEIHARAVSIVDFMNPKLIINMASIPKDIEMGEKLRKISKTYLSVNIDYLGFLYRDKEVHQSIIARKPLALLASQNQTFQTISRIAYKITSLKKLTKSFIDINNYDDSLEEIMEEATDDLRTRIEGYEELMDENLLSINELIVMVTNLEYENLELKKEIEMLKYKLLTKT